jgi:uncharacterized membrane protein YccC
MSLTFSTWKRVRYGVRNHGAELRLSVRVTAAAVSTFFLSELLHLPLALWPVLTSIIVTQLSIGKSLKTTMDYFAGTLGGAVYAGAISALIPPANEAAILAVLAVAVAPLTFLAAINPSFSVAPATAAIVVLAPLITHGRPVESAVYRVIEVALGGGTGLLVSLLVLPARAHNLALEAAGRLLDVMAQALRDLLASAARHLEAARVRRLHDDIARAFARLETIEGEARREQLARLAAEPDLRPLIRTLLRLRHDLVMIGRAVTAPFPDAFQNRLGPLLADAAEAGADYLCKSGAALIRCSPPPPLGAFELTIDDYSAEIAALRQEGLFRDLPSETLERLFALGFALDQLRQNIRDLNQRLADLVK